MMDRYVGQLPPDERLVKLLEKLNVEAARDYQLLKFFNVIRTSYGQPDQVLMSQASFASFQQALSTPPGEDD